MPCHHIWIQDRKDETFVSDGLTVTRYFHRCPQCGKLKTTDRASRALPKEIKWKRELEKLVAKAAEDKCRFVIENIPLHMNSVSVMPN